MIKYNKTQYGILINGLIILIMLFITITYWHQTGAKPIPFTVFIIFVPLFVILFLFFYKLTIKIDNKNIVVIFGIGLIKKSVKIKDININSIVKVKMPWYYGIGIRLTSKGWLWNVKIGDAIYFKTKDNKTFLVGTDDTDEIIKILKNEYQF